MWVWQNARVTLENLLNLRLTHTMLATFGSVAIVPVKARYFH
jgi:hypothetical protein